MMAIFRRSLLWVSFDQFEFVLLVSFDTYTGLFWHMWRCSGMIARQWVSHVCFVMLQCDGVLHYVAVCCSVLDPFIMCVSLCCSVTVCGCVLHYVAVCCSVLQCVRSLSHPFDINRNFWTVCDFACVRTRLFVYWWIWFTCFITWLFTCFIAYLFTCCITCPFTSRAYTSFGILVDMIAVGIAC